MQRNPALSGQNPGIYQTTGQHWAKQGDVTHSKGGDPDEWPKALRVRMFPEDKRLHLQEKGD